MQTRELYPCPVGCLVFSQVVWKEKSWSWTWAQFGDSLNPKHPFELRCFNAQRFWHGKKKQVKQKHNWNRFCPSLWKFCVKNIYILIFASIKKTPFFFWGGELHDSSCLRCIGNYMEILRLDWNLNHDWHDLFFWIDGLKSIRFNKKSKRHIRVGMCIYNITVPYMEIWVRISEGQQNPPFETAKTFAFFRMTSDKSGLLHSIRGNIDSLKLPGLPRDPKKVGAGGWACNI